MAKNDKLSRDVSQVGMSLPAGVRRRGDLTGHRLYLNLYLFGLVTNYKLNNKAANYHSVIYGLLRVKESGLIS